MTEHLKLNSFPEKGNLYSTKSFSIIKNTQYIKLFIILFNKYLVYISKVTFLNTACVCVACTCKHRCMVVFNMCTHVEART